jgi:CDP-diacylglycerol---glycerol-3-phosphate 3-phosphatidyltransferase
MKLSNFFTSIRIILAPFFFLLFFFPKWTGFGAQISVFILIPLFVFMELTDYLDGHFARKQNTVSDFGKLFDPFADVLANLTILFAFVLSGYLPAILFLVILYREMGIMFVRMIASRNGVAIGARKGGKTKTVLYIIAASVSLAIESAIRLGFPIQDYLAVARGFNLGLYILSVAMSLFSFIDYLIHFSSVLRTTEEKF